MDSSSGAQPGMGEGGGVQLREELERLGALREEANRQREEATTRTRELIPRAAAAGLSTNEIAALAKVSRQTVWQLLPPDPRRRRSARP